MSVAKMRSSVMGDSLVVLSLTEELPGSFA